MFDPDKNYAKARVDGWYTEDHFYFEDQTDEERKIRFMVVYRPGEKEQCVGMIPWPDSDEKAKMFLEMCQTVNSP